jgi:hypothetical protein
MAVIDLVKKTSVHQALDTLHKGASSRSMRTSSEAAG